MRVTSVRVTLTERTDGQLRAFCAIVLDGEFAIHDVKVVDGHSGLFVSMPSRKAHTHCPACEKRSDLLANYCQHCGRRMPAPEIPLREDGGGKLHFDIAHPITHECRAAIHAAVIEAYMAAVKEQHGVIVAVPAF